MTSCGQLDLECHPSQSENVQTIFLMDKANFKDENLWPARLGITADQL